MKALIGFAFMALATTASADTDSDSAEVTVTSNLQICLMLSGASGRIMAYRQDGVPVADMVKLLEQPKYEQYHPELMEMVVENYGIVQIATPEYKKWAVEHAKNSVFVKCMSGGYRFHTSATVGE